MPKQILDSADVHTSLQQVGSEGVPQRVARRPFGEASLAGGFLKLTLHGILVKVFKSRQASTSAAKKARERQSDFAATFKTFITHWI